MKHDFSINPTGDEADKFINWLREETISSLKTSHGDLEKLKSSLFLYVNRAYESKLNEDEIYKLLAVAIVRAGYCENEEGPVFDLFESFSQIAKGTHEYNI